MAFVSNYNGGQLSVYPLDKNGNFEKFPIVFQHQGSSVHNKRQTKPHVHCSIVDPDNKKLLVADLGLDKIVVYKINHKRQSCNLDTTFKLKDGLKKTYSWINSEIQKKGSNLSRFTKS